MLAKLWVKELEKEGTTKTFKDVPKGLKDAVKDLLKADGREDLITE